MVMGMEEDPEDNKAVATAVFITVAIYGVCTSIHMQFHMYG